MYLKRLRTYKKIGFRVVSDGIADKQVANAIYDAGNYTGIFEQDLIEAEHSVIVSSPGITQEKIKRFLYLMKPKQEAGINVKMVVGETGHFAVMDDHLVWHGGMNLLGKEDVWDNLIRVRDMNVAAELLLLALDTDGTVL